MRMRVAMMFLAVTVMASPVLAQNAIGGGVKVGVNFASISTDDDDEDEDFGTRTGLVVGAFADIGINDQMSFQPEFLYTQKGASIDFTEGTTTLNADLKLDMVQIPLLLKFGFAPTGSVRPFVVVGPGLGFVTSAKIEAGAVEEDIKDTVKAFEFSGIVGAGLQFGPGTVELRYDHGFNNLDDEEDEGGTAKSRTVSIVVGFGWR